MATIKIDGKEVTAPDGTTVLDAAEGIGISIPRFCYHRALGPIGSCRVCLVEVKGRLVQACLTTIQDGMEIRTDTEAVIKTRERMIELILLHHPLDCPICDQGGECTLQDIAFLSGPRHGRYKGKKRVYQSQYLGPFVHLEMNRCIHCYRCIRFYQDVAGGRDFGAMGIAREVTFGRDKEGKLESVFSGNLVEVCPTGALMDRTFLATSRIWDMKRARSICPHCSLGCNSEVGSRWGDLLRVTNRLDPDVNGYFLCDLGRFGYGFVNSKERVGSPMLRDGGGFRAISWEEAYRIAIERIKGAGSIAALGSGRGTLEANQLLRALFKYRLRTHDIDAFSDPGEGTAVRKAIGLMERGIGKRVSLGDLPSSDLILLIGVDPTNEAPLIDLKIREAVAKGAMLITAHPLKISLAELSYRHIPFINSGLLEDKGLYDLFRDSKNPLLLCGTFDPAVVEVSAILVEIIEREKDEKIGLDFLFRRCNTLGAAQAIGPVVQGIEGIVEKSRKGEMGLLYVMEDDPVRYYPKRRRINEALKGVGFLIVQDVVKTDTALFADLILPSATFAEMEGTFINFEGRAQTFQGVMKPHVEAKGASTILRELAIRLGFTLSQSLPPQRTDFNPPIPQIPLNPPLLKGGEGGSDLFPYQLISGGILFGSDDLSSYAPVMQEVISGGFAEMNPRDAVREGVEEGDRLVVISEEGRLEVALRVSTRIPQGVVFIPYGLKTSPVNNLLSEDGTGYVRVERLR